MAILFLAGVIHNSSFIIQKVDAATNIDSTYRYAWNDTIGWIDFYSTGNVSVSSTQLTGYASSSVGYIALNCNSTPNGDICATRNFKVSNDGSGNLSGWAYNDGIGWISFASSTATSTYQVSVSPTTGDFSGWAWNDVVGWISFNCFGTNTCPPSGPSDYKVKTNWQAVSASGNLTSSIFDTGVTNGTAINTIMWQGNQPAGTSVKFQIASVNSLTGGGTGPIDTTYRYAWADTIGWIDFGWPAGNVNVGTTQLTGYAYNNNVGEIALDCATAPGGNICQSQSNFKVNRNPANGNLSGWAWNDYIGWTSFSSENNSTPITCNPSDGFGTGEYCVTINPTTGTFTGWAWNDYIGWISVNCADPGLCGSSNYWVNTATAATWTYRGPDGSGTSYYSSIGPGIPTQINLGYHNNQRYFRYKIFLYSDTGQTASPRVDDVILNYSP